MIELECPCNEINQPIENSLIALIGKYLPVGEENQFLSLSFILEYKTKKCPHLEKGPCKMRSSCFFFHSIEDARPSVTLISIFFI